MKNKTVAIIGCGTEGKVMRQLFTDAAPYDKYAGPYQGEAYREAANRCGTAFVCVPTPMNPDGSCDVTEVDDVISWLECPLIVLRSTVPVGYTDRKMSETGKHIVFQPEYYGTTVNHPFADLRARKWLTFGGKPEDVRAAIAVYQTVMNSDIRIYMADAKTAELAKYMENAFLATKVTFCNEFFDIAEKFGVSYDALREVWTADPRIGGSHTFVYEDARGYGGACLPKDMAAIIRQAEEIGADPALLRAVQSKNARYGNPAPSAALS